MTQEEKIGLIDLQDQVNGAKRRAVALRLAIAGIAACAPGKEGVEAVEEQAIQLMDCLADISTEVGMMRGEDSA